MQVLEAIVANMEGEYVGASGKKNTALQEEFKVQNRLAEHPMCDWDPVVSLNLSKSIPAEFTRHDCIGPDLCKALALALQELRSLFDKCEEEVWIFNKLLSGCVCAG